MKINKNDYTRLEELITDSIIRHAILPINNYSDSPMRYRWNIFHIMSDYCRINSREDYLFIRGLYNYMNDNHIDTALRKILKDMLCTN